ncbi:MAG: hypothetical protein JKY52_09150 [Flavobacteriales bacterium]|nr:hypothetical protein [Flavobacteriales bacterium]
MDDQKFTPLTGKITYTGADTQHISLLRDEGETLNGVKMEVGKTYPLNHGDIIETKGRVIGADNLKWSFRDE